MRLKHVVAFLVAVPLAAHGQQSGIAPGSEPERVRDVMVFAGTAHYPQELADKGVQGTAVLSTEVRVDGTFGPSVLVESSGSPELDATAVALASTLKANRQEVAKPVLLPIVFYKDGMSNLHLKTCAEFNADQAYFAATFPSRPVGDMNIFKMATAAVVAINGINMSSIGKLNSAPQKTAEACAKRPKRLFLEEFLASTKS